MPSPWKEEKSSTSFSDLPAALQAKICTHLRGSPYQTVRDMTAFRSTSRAQSEILRHEGYPWPLAQELRSLVLAVGQLFREEETRLSSLRHLLEVQGTLSGIALIKGLREHASAPSPLPLYSPKFREEIIGLANRTLRERLAEHATAFGPALGVLSPGQRGTLARLVDYLPDEEKPLILGFRDSGVRRGRPQRSGPLSTSPQPSHGLPGLTSKVF